MGAIPDGLPRVSCDEFGDGILHLLQAGFFEWAVAGVGQHTVSTGTRVTRDSTGWLNSSGDQRSSAGCVSKIGQASNPSGSTAGT